MISGTLKIIFRYTERALTPGAYTELTTNNIQSKPLFEIMHQLTLFQHNINVFDYDYYTRSCYGLLNHQRKMKVADIMTVLRLGIKHNIKNQMIWKHLESELHHRLHKAIHSQLISESKQIEEKMGKIIESLEAKSVDYFEILAQDVPAQNYSDLQNSPTATQTKEEANLKQSTGISEMKTPKFQILSHAYSLTEVLIWHECENGKLLNLLLEAQLQGSALRGHPANAINIVELLMYICQVHMKVYEQNKGQFTPRSVKNIYKFQGLYLPEVMKILKQSIHQFSSEQVSYLIEILRSFPIKKRAHRKQIVQLLAPLCENSRQLKGKLEEVLADDKKLIAHFKLIDEILQTIQ